MRHAARAALLALLAVCSIAATEWNTPRWNRVRDALSKGLPQSALTSIDPLIRDAQARGDWPEAIRAILLKVALEAGIQGNKPEEKITRLEKTLDGAPAPMRPVLELILADWYWQYFQQNRWRFLRRTATAASPGGDFTTWDLPRLYAEIDRHLGRALAGAPMLKRIRIADYDRLIDRGNTPDSYRPTLYDFVVFEALQFYGSGEQAAAAPEDAFVLQAASPVFGAREEFLRWQISTGDSASPVVKSLRLYQDALRFHADDHDASALIDADLWRLEYAHQHAVGSTREARYAAALQALIERHENNELSTRAIHALAELRRQQGDLVAAWNLAKRGEQRFPKSVGGIRCHNLIEQIEEKSLQVTVSENVWNAPPPTLQVMYRNLERAYFRLVPFDFEARVDRGLFPTYGWYGWDPSERDSLIAQRPVRQWSADLPPTRDFRARQERLPVPSGVPPGCYVLLSSGRADFKGSDNVVAIAMVWISDLALVLREARPKGLEGFVLDARDGDPIEGAEVRYWVRGSIPGPETRTDRNGLFRIEERVSIVALMVTKESRRLGYSDPAPFGDTYKPGASEQTLFFTDRALYRPGQTIQYKGLCIRVDRERDDYSTLPRDTVRVLLEDENGQDIARQQHVTNDHGSFSGSFIAPEGGLRGTLVLRTEGPPSGSAAVRVEEYKRPKFVVSLEAPAVAPRLGDRAELTGLALAYTGAPIQNAKVEWRVVREVRFPDWCYWFYGYGGGAEAQAIAHDTTTTDAEGRFRVAFVARPDSAVSAEQSPIFRYTVTADLTDGTGETRSASRTFQVGYAALMTSLSAPEWLESERSVDLTVKTLTLDGVPVSAEGHLSVLQLHEPSELSHMPPPRWTEGPSVAERDLRTDSLGTATVALPLKPGFYRARWRARDRFGKEVTALATLRVLDLHGSSSKLEVRDLFVARSTSVEPGSEFLGFWCTGYDRARVFVEVECRGRILQSYWTAPTQTQVVVHQPVTEKMRGGFTVRLTRVAENRPYLHEVPVDVPWSDRKLDLKWEHFVSKLTPGVNESWTAVIRGRGATRVAAEMVATLYDASLEAFVPLSWQRILGFRENDDRRNPVGTVNPVSLLPMLGNWTRAVVMSSLVYRSLPRGLLWGDYTYGFPVRRPLPSMGRFFIPGPGPNEDRARIAGTVRGPNGAAVAYANVIVLGTKLGAMTDNAGHFVVSDLAPGSYRVQVQALGFDKVSQATRVQAGETKYLDFVLGGSKVVKEIDMLEVRAGRRIDSKASTSKQSISSEKLQELPVDNLSMAVATKAGVVASSDGLHFRGGRAGEVNFQFDGLEVSEAARLNQVRARRDLRETAFFFPHLKANGRGEVRMSFTAPEALGQWRFLAFAHDNSLRSGTLEARAVTSKDLMVQPNAPRFLREGDELEFTVKVTNRSDQPQHGSVRLTFTDASDEGSADARLENLSPIQPLDLPPRESRTHAWRLRVPDGARVLRYKAVASTDKLSDGEEGWLPVLSRRVLVVESLPLPIRGPATRTFEFAHLSQSGQSPTLRQQALTVQVVSNPAWYAVMALPYLMEYPHECSEQTFNRLYANTLARHIANSQPGIRAVFDQWRGTPALDSPLEKDPALKSVLISETPWLRQAKSESQARRNVGILFEPRRLDRETQALLDKLSALQSSSGMWPWFPGGHASEYITLYITTGFGRLRHLGVDVPMTSPLRALDALDAMADGWYRDILRYSNPDANHLSPLAALYLYGRSFFLKDRPIGANRKEAVEYWLRQARSHWLEVPDRQTRGHLALALMRFGDAATAKAIMRSVREYSVNDPEMGMFWRDTEYSWWWYRAPIETQALMVEAFDEVMGDSAAVEDCRVWLLKQKQTQDWKTTKATADAVYALLLRGTNFLVSKRLVEVTLGDSVVRPLAVEAGTGFYEKRFAAAAVRPEMGRVKLAKADAGVAWGSVHWQYFEDMDRVPAYAGTPLRLEKSIWVRRTGKAGRELHALDGPVRVGDELVTRVVLRTDRDMEYVHLKDYRGSGVEPVNVLSGYRYQDGLRYYEETRDVASNFFIDYLPKGTYVFEYPVRVQHRGRYTSGVAQVQCMYAPEFNGHSGAVTLVAE